MASGHKYSGVAAAMKTRGGSVFLLFVATAFGGFLVLWPAFATLACGATVAIVSTVCIPRWLGVPLQVRRWAAISFALHAGLGLIITHTPSFISYLGSDADFYHQSGIELANHWHGLGSMPWLPRGKEGFPYMLGALYWLGAPLRDAVVLVNAGLASALVAIIWWSTRRVFHERAAAAAVPLTVLFPGMVIWQSQLLREAAIFLLLGIFAAASARLVARVSVGSLAVFAVTFAVLSSFRGPVALSVLAGAALAILLGTRRISAWLMAVSGVTAALSFVAVLGIGLSGLQFASDLNLGKLGDLRRASAESAASGFGAEVDVSTTDGALSYLPAGLIHVVLGPWPWEVRGVRQLPALVDAAAWWLLLPSLARGLRCSWKERRWPALVFILPAFFLSAGLAISVGNFGTILRLRTQILVLLLPVIAAGCRERHGVLAPEFGEPSRQAQSLIDLGGDSSPRLWGDA